jgi:hypothetical protein
MCLERILGMGIWYWIMDGLIPLFVVKRTCTVGLPRESSRWAAVMDVMYETMMSFIQVRLERIKLREGNLGMLIKSYTTLYNLEKERLGCGMILGRNTCSESGMIEVFEVFEKRSGSKPLLCDFSFGIDGLN